MLSWRLWQHQLVHHDMLCLRPVLPHAGKAGSARRSQAGSIQRVAQCGGDTAGGAHYCSRSKQCRRCCSWLYDQCSAAEAGAAGCTICHRLPVPCAAHMHTGMHSTLPGVCIHCLAVMLREKHFLHPLTFHPLTFQPLTFLCLAAHTQLLRGHSALDSTALLLEAVLPSLCDQVALARADSSTLVDGLAALLQQLIAARFRDPLLVTLVRGGAMSGVAAAAPAANLPYTCAKAISSLQI